jgi:protein-tyrosine phosphatase
MESVMLDRNLEWEGCFNARDLGGLPTVEGRQTRWGAVVRSDSLDHLTTAGWSALEAHDIRTIVDLRNDEELEYEAQARPDAITTVHVPLDDISDTDFWKYLWDEELDGTPLPHRPFLERKPERCAAAVAAVARAEPGGVVVHCGIGRDRTGIVALLLLALVGVTLEEIASDYELSNERLRPHWAGLGWEDQSAWAEERLKREGTSARDLILATLASLGDLDAYFRMRGLDDENLAALRVRLGLYQYISLCPPFPKRTRCL